MTSSSTAVVANPPVLQEVADGVHAYTQRSGGWCVSNAGIVVGDDGALVVDTLGTQSRALGLVATVDRLCPSPRRVVVNTHFHGDHTFGNHEFGPSAVIIGHERIRAEMAGTGLALTGLWPAVDWGDVRVTLPSITFTDRMTVHIGQYEARLIHPGVAHTTNDVVVWLPAARVLFAGDLVMSGATPFNLMGSVRGSLAALRELALLEPVTVIGGHGPVAGPAVIDRNIAYLEWIERLAAEGSAAGLAPLDVARQSDLGEFADLLDPERIVGNLHRAFAELDTGGSDSDELGRPLDVLAVFEEMVAFNGGEVPTCLA